MRKKPTYYGRRKKKFSRKLKISLYGAAVLVFALMCLVASVGMGSAVRNRTEIFISTGSSYKAVQDSLRQSGNIKMLNFNILSRAKSYPERVLPGRYVLQRGMTARQVVEKLRRGHQDQVKVTFNKVRTVAQLAGVISKQIEADSASLATLLSDSAYLASFQYPLSEDASTDAPTQPFDTRTVLAVFIPNTYYFYWNTDAEGFFRRMYGEQNKFWNDFRKGQAYAIKLNRVQVSTLASIVEEETLKTDERPDIASVYMNRLRKGMLLQADPTVKYAVGDFALRRILKEHLQADSPYNTYKNKGLPPGPICTPSVSSLDAVLQNKPTNYLYFCARADFCGYHSFAADYAHHRANARAYQKALTERGITK
ncbi:endolytic transglycosylase MltG [bacterium]|nr:endolytic transglycosylase MltG [bacterium]